METITLNSRCDFAKWFLNKATEVVKFYMYDVFIDIHRLYDACDTVRHRNRNTDFTWYLRETGTFMEYSSLSQSGHEMRMIESKEVYQMRLTIKRNEFTAEITKIK